VAAPSWWQEAPPRLAGAALLAGGVAAWIRQPSPRVGQLIVLGSALYYAQFFRAADGALFTAGFWLAYSWTAVATHVLLAWPTGRLTGTVSRVFVACGYVAAIGTQVIRYFVDHPRSPWALHLQEPGSMWGTIGTVCGVAMGAGALALAAHRWLSSPVRRPPSGPVWVGIMAAASFKIAEGAASIVPTPFALRLALGWLFTVTALAVVPAVALVRWLQLKFGYRRVVEVLLSLEKSLPDLADPTTVRQALSGALGDPTLTVAYRLADGEYVGIDGQPAAVGEGRPGRSVTPVRRRDTVIAVIEHDAALDEQRQVTEGMVAAAGLAIENARLYATMQAQLDQIRYSRLRLAQTAFDERQRIQRDLHDGAQQRFFTVLLLLDRAQQALASGQDPADQATQAVRRARAELTEALRTMRELTQGIYPAVLAEHGLPTAVANLIDRAPVPVHFTAAEARWPRHIEMTAYLVISEALANVYKHAAATHARIDVRDQDQRLVVSITDDGSGGARDNGGLGLASLRSRVDAVGGTLTIDSEPGKGTTLTAVIPHPDLYHPRRHPATEQP
jgi:signal transduction histidine kinase